jgi:hypothetical protein
MSVSPVGMYIYSCREALFCRGDVLFSVDRVKKTACKLACEAEGPLSISGQAGGTTCYFGKKTIRT